MQKFDMSALRSLIDDDPSLTKLVNSVKTGTIYVKLKDLAIEPDVLGECVQDDPGHGTDHFYRVAVWAMNFGEGKLSARNVVPAAFLHDLINFPKNHPNRKLASEYSAKYAYELLKTFGWAETEASEIADAIRTHSFSRGEKPNNFLGQALQDADRIEALGVLGFFRLISTGTLMGAQYFDPDDPWAKNRPLDDQKFMIDHCFVKLFKLPETMNTSLGRAEAEHRMHSMRKCLSELGEELGDRFC